MSQRTELAGRIFHRLREEPGVGQKKASQCANAVMEVLDELVERHYGADNRRDYLVDRPTEVPQEYSYVAFLVNDGEISNCWVYADRPEIRPSVSMPLKLGVTYGLFGYISNNKETERLMSQLMEIYNTDHGAFFARFKDA